MDTMDCIQARNLLSEYQDGTLDAAVATALNAHLRGCGECDSCAGSLLAVRRLLQELPPDPAPPELLERVLGAVESEGRDAGADSVSSWKDAAKPFSSRFRVPLEAAAVVLLFASVYWYQRNPAPAARPPSAPVTQAPGTAPHAIVSPETLPEGAKGSPSGVRLPRGNPKTAREEAPAAAMPRAWTAADLPSAPALRASTDSERIAPVVPSPGPATDPAAEGAADSRPSGVFSVPPSQFLRPLPYGRDIEVDVKREGRAGTEERIAEAAFRSGGIVERIERRSAAAESEVTGSVHVILPEAAAAGFIEELRRIGTVPPEGLPPGIDFPAGPQPGTVAYAVRIRVR